MTLISLLILPLKTTILHNTRNYELTITMRDWHISTISTVEFCNTLVVVYVISVVVVVVGSRIGSRLKCHCVMFYLVVAIAVGASVGGAVLLLIIVPVIICLCMYCSRK